MERAEKTGLVASGAGHAALLLWLLLGGFFSQTDTSVPIATTEVSTISSDAFAAMQAAAPKAVTQSPAALKPQPKPKPEPAPKPVAEKPPEAPPPQPEPQPQPEPDAAPDQPDVTAPDTQVTDQVSDLPTPPVEPQVDPLPTPEPPQPDPKAADIVAPNPTDVPTPDAPPADQVVEDTTPSPADQQTDQQPADAATPKDTGQVIKTEDNKDQTKVASAAPATSARPKAKPKKPAPAPEPAPAADQPTDTAPADQPATDQAAVDAALADALGGDQADTPQAGTGTAASGPPMTSGEKDALVVAVKGCWNVGSLSTDALRTIVTVGVSMGQDGKPDAGSIHMIGYEGGDETAANMAFEAGRRAILRCAKDGYALPQDKYDQWKDIEIVFNPQKMRMK